MYQIYTVDTLKIKKLEELKAIATPLGAVAEDRRSKQSWIDAIVAAQPVKVEPIKFDVDGDEVLADGEAIASITCDDDLTQPWIVAIDGVEIHRTGTWAQSFSYVCRHYKQGSLPIKSEPNDDYLFHDDEPQQPANLPEVGDTYIAGDFILRCTQVGAVHAAVWAVYKGKTPMGEIRMGWDCFWRHSWQYGLFATPQEALADLCELSQKVPF